MSTLTPPTCDRHGCNQVAAYERLTTDADSRGFNLNEPGGRMEKLCLTHAEEVRMYVGGRLWPILERWKR